MASKSKTTEKNGVVEEETVKKPRNTRYQKLKTFIENAINKIENGEEAKALDVLKKALALADGTGGKREPNQYNLFVADNMKDVMDKLRADNPDTTQKDCMSVIGEMWNKHKAKMNIKDAPKKTPKTKATDPKKNKAKKEDEEEDLESDSSEEEKEEEKINKGGKNKPNGKKKPLGNKTKTRKEEEEDEEEEKKINNKGNSKPKTGGKKKVAKEEEEEEEEEEEDEDDK